MPSVSPQVLVNAILDAIQQSGATAILTSTLKKHPRKFLVTSGDSSASLWVYAWTLTPGGRPQLANEYRIQMTSVESPLEENPDGHTILIGFEPDLVMFAGFDLERHRRFTTGSPSVQIDIRTLHRALQDGLAFSRKENGEVAIGVRPDQFLAYALNARPMHLQGADIRTFNFLNAASALADIDPPSLESLTAERRQIVQTVTRLSRAANFRQQVIQAYGNRCAITRIQLRLVDAAHILPVGAPGSSDHVSNGIALSPTYHRAFDSGLIYLNEDYEMRLNIEREVMFRELNLGGGTEIFRAPLGRIHLPPDPQQWPDVRFIQRANRFRRIS